MGRTGLAEEKKSRKEGETKKRDAYTLTHDEFMRYNNRLQLLGNGGFGKVYKIICDIEPEKIYAMKVIDVQEVTHRYMLDSPMKLASRPNTPARNPELRNELRQHILVSLLNEVKIVRGLKHPNIVSIFHYYMDGEKMHEKENTVSMKTPRHYGYTSPGPKHLYIIMEYSKYGSLLKYIKSQPRRCLSEMVSAGITLQILEGLIYLASLSIVHGDIKAANILIFPNGVIKLCDFGLSFQWDDENMDDYDDYQHVSKISSNKQLQKIATNGSAYWLAPEIILHRMATPKSDIWSLGATVIEMLTGNPPFSNRGPLSACHAVGSGAKIEYPIGIGVDCRSFLDSCFQYDPTLRSRARTLRNHSWIKHVKKNILEFIEINADDADFDDTDLSSLADNNSVQEREKKQLLEQFKEEDTDFEFSDSDFDVGTLRVQSDKFKDNLSDFKHLSKLGVKELRKMPIADTPAQFEVLQKNYTSTLIETLRSNDVPDQISRTEELLRIGKQFLRLYSDELRKFCFSGGLVPLSISKENGSLSQDTVRLIEDLILEVFQSRGREWLLVAGFETGE